MTQDQFIYTGFRLNDDRRAAYFDFTLQHQGEAHNLTETLVFPMPLADTPEIQRALRATHLAVGISYYKMFLHPIVHPYAMEQAEADFWNSVWRGGLGEFLYHNKLSADQLFTFTPQDGTRFDGDSTVDMQGAILGIGGGKDSIVAGEMLKEIGVPVTGFVMATGEQLGQAAAVAKTMEADIHAVQRSIDKQLIDLQEQPGGYKGHIPISLIFGLVGTLLALTTKAAYVVVANEASSSIPQHSWQGQAVNHQWSKAFSAERQLQQFIHEAISPSVTYFSAIRQLTSLGVAKIFANFSQYFEVFTSDNFVFRIDPAKRPSGRWGLESPKSLSSYLLLAPWLSDSDVARIFQMDLMNEPSLEKLFLELTGVDGEPPLDCVGTVEELVLSVNLLAQAGRYQNTHLMQVAKDRGVIHGDDWSQKLQVLLQLQPDHATPADLTSTIETYLQERLAA